MALIAHDARKDAMVAFCARHAATLSRLPLLGTGTTGSRVAEATGLPVACVLSGPLGGDAQIGALVATGGCAAVIFLTDPLTAHPHEPDILSLLRLCNVHEVPVASNLATAEAVIAMLAAADAGGGAAAALAAIPDANVVLPKKKKKKAAA